jgi:hypothetical protein
MADRRLVRFPCGGNVAGRERQISVGREIGEAGRPKPARRVHGVVTIRPSELTTARRTPVGREYDDMRPSTHEVAAVAAGAAFGRHRNNWANFEGDSVVPWPFGRATTPIDTIRGA